jgi:hypothetical protein
MIKSRSLKQILILLSIFIVTVACSLPFGTSNNTENTPTDENAPAPSITSGTTEVNSKPVGLQEGLGSLDTYQLAFTVNMHDSKGKITKIDEFAERSIADKNSHSVTTTTSFDPENDTEQSTDTTETYVIGNATCTKSGDEWTYTSMSAQEKELTDIFSKMVDFLPLIDNPVFVAEENINGIDTNHFTFKVKGVGESSGAVASVNSGEYWLAKDGQYIVKYQLALEVRSAAEGNPNADVSNLEILFNVTNINAPLSLALPAGCEPEK